MTLLCYHCSCLAHVCTYINVYWYINTQIYVCIFIKYTRIYVQMQMNIRYMYVYKHEQDVVSLLLLCVSPSSTLLYPVEGHYRRARIKAIVYTLIGSSHFWFTARKYFSAVSSGSRITIMHINVQVYTQIYVGLDEWRFGKKLSIVFLILL